MYAVIEQGGKQYKIAEGDRINIELANVEPDAGTMELDKVLFINDDEKIQVGAPYLKGAKVVVSFNNTAGESVVKGKKLYPTHFRKRKNSTRRIGHRQRYLQVVVDKIKA
jgi:large subunit ribosomal protein L21